MGHPTRSRRIPWLLLGAAGLAIGVVCYIRLPVSIPPIDDADAAVSPLEDNHVAAAAQAIAFGWKDAPIDTATLPARLRDANQGVYLAARKDGRLLAEVWGADGGTVWDGIRTAMTRAREQIPTQSPDTLQLDLLLSIRQYVYPQDRNWLVTDIFRGVRGMTVHSRFGTERLSPSATLARNQSMDDFIDGAIPWWARLWDDPEEVRSRHRYETFGADQLLVSLQPDIGGIRLSRGSRLVPPSAVTAATLTHTAALQAQWLQHTQEPAGALTYLYLPSREERAPRLNNMIRRWMASVALVRWAQHTGRESDWTSARRSIEHNLSTHYFTEGDLGHIRWQGKVKLGALALAAYALHTHRDAAAWSDEEAAIRRTIDTLVNADGSMDSWADHPNRDASNLDNFYPGEALFYWAQVIADGGDPNLLERYMRSFRYYRRWHLEPQNRNPAFVPWHTQAHFQVWQQTGDPELAAFIFEMNDWLLDIQQWDDIIFLDTQGRFYAPNSGFGQPHASATGVYMEGLIDAYRLAVAVGDAGRAEAYRVAMLRGARSIMQLQFRDDVDAFYVHDKDMVIGGVRSRVWDNRIRCDNVQHPMMAIIKMLQHLPPEALTLVSEQ